MRASSRILYYGHSTKYSHLVTHESQSIEISSQRSRPIPFSAKQQPSVKTLYCDLYGQLIGLRLIIIVINKEQIQFGKIGNSYKIKILK